MCLVHRPVAASILVNGWRFVQNKSVTQDQVIRYTCNISPRESEGVCFTGVGLCVCLSVATINKRIVDGFVPKFMGGSKVERKDEVHVSLRSVEGCGSNE